jgi:hypothetical protein
VPAMRRERERMTKTMKTERGGEKRVQSKWLHFTMCSDPRDTTWHYRL